tara:strand:+ start:904 stop:1275 length:372 start_codon:yes stop_codon:yes gene_type:complete
MAASSEDFWAKLGQTDSKALDQLYACNQASEILGRTRRIVDRIMPQKPTPHGFWDPEGLIQASRLSSHRRLFAKSIQERIAQKVKLRDRTLTPAQKAERMKDPRLGYGLNRFTYRPLATRMAA